MNDEYITTLVSSPKKHQNETSWMILLNLYPKSGRHHSARIWTTARLYEAFGQTQC